MAAVAAVALPREGGKLWIYRRPTGQSEEDCGSAAEARVRYDSLVRSLVSDGDHYESDADTSTLEAFFVVKPHLICLFVDLDMLILGFGDATLPLRVPEEKALAMYQRIKSRTERSYFELSVNSARLSFRADELCGAVYGSTDGQLLFLQRTALAIRYADAIEPLLAARILEQVREQLAAAERAVDGLDDQIVVACDLLSSVDAKGGCLELRGSHFDVTYELGSADDSLALCDRLRSQMRGKLL